MALPSLVPPRPPPPAPRYNTVTLFCRRQRRPRRSRQQHAHLLQRLFQPRPYLHHPHLLPISRLEFSPSTQELSNTFSKPPPWQKQTRSSSRAAALEVPPPLPPETVPLSSIKRPLSPRSFHLPPRRSHRKLDEGAALCSACRRCDLHSGFRVSPAVFVSLHCSQGLPVCGFFIDHDNDGFAPPWYT
jgi:hypothetical protein